MANRLRGAPARICSSTRTTRSTGGSGAGPRSRRPPGATCHWCHVIARESFEDPETAALMNRWFACVEVDREEPLPGSAVDTEVWAGAAASLPGQYDRVNGGFDGAPAAYACRGYVCERPVTSVDELVAAPA